LPKELSVRMTRLLLLVLGSFLLTVLFVDHSAQAGRRRGPPVHEPIGFQSFTSPQSNPIALAPNGDFVYVANTTSNSVSVIATSNNTVIAEVSVGLEPSGVGVRPDGLEVWVSNHISDSVSVIDTNAANPTYLTVVETIQDVDSDGVTQFDEPVGIAFASNSKAYVALSSRNDIAVVDATTYSVTNRIHITAQDPRAITVRNGRLYAVPFESSNQSELSVCPDSPTNPPQCTMDQNDIEDFLLESPNVPGSDTRIVIDPDVPDRDLFVFDTSNDQPITGQDTVEGVGTLLYGVAVDSNNVVYITQADARNEVNGEDGENLVEIDNRLFLNQISVVDCGGAGGCSAPSVIALEDEPTLPAPSTSHPDPSPTCATGAPPRTGCALATPFGIALSDDDSTLVVTAMGTSRVFTVDTATGNVLDILDLGVGADFGQQIPKGVALRSSGGGAPLTAYVLNTLENTVSVVDVSNPSALSQAAKVAVGNDPTPENVRLGRIAFMNAFASDRATFSCESCHPDGHTDQLLWRIGGPCFFGACSGDDEVRSTMPVRGLKNTLPLHWDGTLGENTVSTDGSLGGSGSNPADCTTDQSCFRHLVDASLSGVMCRQDGLGCQNGASGLPGPLTDTERENMAFFLEAVSYPPARSRRADDSVSPSALDGFADFFVDQPAAFPDDLGNLAGITTCADMNSGCHALPLGVATDSSTLAGFDVPTMRGMTDRFLHFSLGITGSEEALVFANTAGATTIGGIPVSFSANPFPWDPNRGYEEDTTFGAAFPIFEPVYNVLPTDLFQMFEEASTGYSGTIGRQVTLNLDTTTGGALAGTEAAMSLLEQADNGGLVNLRAKGVRDAGFGFFPITLSWRADTSDYKNKFVTLSHADMINEAQAGTLIVTLTAGLGQNHGKASFPQPLLAPNTTADGPTGNPDLPVLPGDNPMTVAGIDVRSDAGILVDGQSASGSISCSGGSFTPFCSTQVVVITLDSVPANGLHLLQVQNPSGPLSNELPICVGSVAGCR
jgi:YVTN family beta-propeller protein